MSAYALVEICDNDGGSLRILREQALEAGTETVVIFDRPTLCMQALERQRTLVPEKPVQATRIMVSRVNGMHVVIPKSEMLLVDPGTATELAEAPIVLDCRPEVAHMVDVYTFKDLKFPLIS